MPRAAEFLVALPYRRFCGRSVQGYRLGRLAGIGGSGAGSTPSVPAASRRR